MLFFRVIQVHTSWKVGATASNLDPTCRAPRLCYHVKHAVAIHSDIGTKWLSILSGYRYTRGSSGVKCTGIVHPSSTRGIGWSQDVSPPLDVQPIKLRPVDGRS